MPDFKRGKEKEQVRQRPPSLVQVCWEDLWTQTHFLLLVQYDLQLNHCVETGLSPPGHQWLPSREIPPIVLFSRFSTSKRHLTKLTAPLKQFLPLASPSHSLSPGSQALLRVLHWSFLRGERNRLEPSRTHPSYSVYTHCQPQTTATWRQRGIRVEPACDPTAASHL